MNKKRKMTFTSNLAKVITSNMASVTKAEYYYKSSYLSDDLDTDVFTESLKALSKTKIFSEIVDWKYQVSDVKADELIIYGNPHDKYTGMVFIAHLKLNDGVDMADVEKVLKETIFNKVSA